MNRLFLLLIILSSCHSQAQQSKNDNATNAFPADTIETFNGEFNVYQNGLIYSPYTVNRLTHIVDSLNLRFKRCELNKAFMSLRQGMGYHVKIDGSQAKAAVKDMAAGLSPDELVKKYRIAAGVDSLHIVISRNEYEKEVSWQFEALDFKDYSGVEIHKKGKADYGRLRLANTWVAGEPDGEYDIHAFYFKQEPRATPLPETYARMLLYTECVIDTTTDIYTGPEDAGMFGSHDPQGDKRYNKSKLFAFKSYLQKNTEHLTKKHLSEYYKNNGEYRGLDSMKKAYVRSTLSKQPEFITRLAEAVAEYNAGKTGSEDDFEYYVANYHSKKLALEMKRKRYVVGMCSQDNSPRRHAQQIAMLSAEAVNWETFLRAHLNIMNDRFDRMSDGSYAWARRETYIKELETLNLDVNDLLIGISLRAENTAAKHYYGNISRLGRAFAETADKNLLVNTLLAAIGNEQLDGYNRILMFYLLNHYAYNLKEKAERQEAYGQLLAAKKSLPGYIGEKIVLKEKDYE